MKPKKILLLINISLTGLLLWTATEMIMSWASGRKDTGSLHPVNTAATARDDGMDRKARSLRDYQLIIEHDIFRTRKRSSPIPQKDFKEVKATELDLRLMGTVVGENRESYAIIWDGSTNEEDLYYRDHFIQRARIVKILPDRVILEKDGSEEALILSYETPSAPRIGVPGRGSTTSPSRRPIIRRRPLPPRPIPPRR
jgi:type II secretory pathway component PulC